MCPNGLTSIKTIGAFNKDHSVDRSLKDICIVVPQHTFLQLEIDDRVAYCMVHNTQTRRTPFGRARLNNSVTISGYGMFGDVCGWLINNFAVGYCNGDP